jgi:hypothetical protein
MQEVMIVSAARLASRCVRDILGVIYYRERIRCSKKPILPFKLLLQSVSLKSKTSWLTRRGTSVSLLHGIMVSSKSNATNKSSSDDGDGNAAILMLSAFMIG